MDLKILTICLLLGVVLGMLLMQNRTRPYPMLPPAYYHNESPFLKLIVLGILLAVALFLAKEALFSG